AAYEHGTGSMAERLMDALDAGQSKGGDTRGMQSAGILVVRPLPPNSESTVERIVDIRVDDAEDPFTELRRLLNMTMGVPARLAVRAAELAKEGRHADAIAEMKKALEINPRGETLLYALAQRYAQAGQPREALGPLGDAIRRQPHIWKAQAAADPLFESLRGLPEFQQLVQK
ncbi:MAG: DUF1028 domain-containing protein, partial [Acidobacteriota bacterium]|nr:DUF1028 domain-containing protein [Acidobacteriota bacterium]